MIPLTGNFPREVLPAANEVEGDPVDIETLCQFVHQRRMMIVNRLVRAIQ
jgi:hypothetical protein